MIIDKLVESSEELINLKKLLIQIEFLHKYDYLCKSIFMIINAIKNSLILLNWIKFIVPCAKDYFWFG